MSDDLEEELDFSDLVPVYDYLVEQGFSEVVATAITLQAILRSAVALPEEIVEAAEALRYTLPDPGEQLH